MPRGKYTEFCTMAQRAREALAHTHVTHVGYEIPLIRTKNAPGTRSAGERRAGALKELTRTLLTPVMFTRRSRINRLLENRYGGHVISPLRAPPCAAATSAAGAEGPGSVRTMSKTSAQTVVGRQGKRWSVTLLLFFCRLVGVFF